MKDSHSLHDKQAILEYWSLVEFFTPFVLENAINHKQHYQKVYGETPLKEALPWIDINVIDENDPATPFAKRYHLYLGLFSIEETSDRARHVFANMPSQWQSINWKNSSAAYSTTSFARLTVTTHGIPIFGTLSLSTLPWAHGRILNGDKNSLTDVPILNSFYLQDLESAAISLHTQSGKPIDNYLDQTNDERILLQTTEGAAIILDTLRPKNLPAGRWPDPLSHQQSLMQQFAINALFDPNRTNKIFAVNGPPGTGKTSLLREIIAENIVTRAEALSKFNKAKDVFIGN
jgi:hypothetical protein